MTENKIIKLFMDRDGDSLEDAKDNYRNLKEGIDDIISAGGSYDDVVDELSMFGLEPDYLEMIIL